MSCDSWVFVYKHIADAEDGNGEIIERKVLWNVNSWEIGDCMNAHFNLYCGAIRSAYPDELIDFADDCLEEFDSDEQKFERDVLIELKEKLVNPDPSDRYWVATCS